MTRIYDSPLLQATIHRPRPKRAWPCGGRCSLLEGSTGPPPSPTHERGLANTRRDPHDPHLKGRRGREVLPPSSTHGARYEGLAKIKHFREARAIQHRGSDVVAAMREPRVLGKSTEVHLAATQAAFRVPCIAHGTTKCPKRPATPSHMRENTPKKNGVRAREGRAP